MKKQTKSKAGVLASTLLVSSVLYGTLYSNIAKADAAQDFIDAITAAGGDAAAIASATWQKAKSEVLKIQGTAKEWNAAAFNDVLAIANQYSVAIDQIVPSIQGCIKEQDGTPLVGTTVISIGSEPGIAGSALPLLAVTRGQATPAFIFGSPTVGIAVDESWLSAEQKQNWGPGCYWFPVLPGLAEALVGTIRQESYINARVIPVAPGYEMSPPAKYVNKSVNTGVLTVEDLTSGFELLDLSRPL